MNRLAYAVHEAVGRAAPEATEGQPIDPDWENWAVSPLASKIDPDWENWAVSPLANQIDPEWENWAAPPVQATPRRIA